MRGLPLVLPLLGVALALGGCRPTPPARAPLTVFAAASLADVLAGIGSRHQHDIGGSVVFNFAGSNDLARQIEAGAPADLFISADRAQIERLEAAGRLVTGSAEPLFGNRLVVVVAAADPRPPLDSVAELVAFPRLSLADPEAVPAGVYARRWLEQAGLWPELRARVVPALDVRAALAAVASGNLPAGIVYATDVASTRAVRVVLEGGIDAPAVRYFGAVVRGGAEEEGRRLLAFLRGEEAQAAFRAAGFEPLSVRTP